MSEDLEDKTKLITWGEYNKHYHLLIAARNCGIKLIKGIPLTNTKECIRLLSNDKAIRDELKRLTHLYNYSGSILYRGVRK